MRLLFSLFSFSLLGHLFTSCSQSTSRTPDQSKESHTVPDTTDFAVIPFDQNHDWPFEKTYKPMTLSEDEIKQIDSIFKGCVQDFNQSLTPGLKEGLSIDFAKYNYKRQYMAVLNDKAEKEVWINGFCDSDDRKWRTDVIHVKDGGNCYFNLKINLMKYQCFELMVNESP